MNFSSTIFFNDINYGYRKIIYGSFRFISLWLLISIMKRCVERFAMQLYHTSLNDRKRLLRKHISNTKLHLVFFSWCSENFWKIFLRKMKADEMKNLAQRLPYVELQNLFNGLLVFLNNLYGKCYCILLQIMFFIHRFIIVLFMGREGSTVNPALSSAFD